MSKAIIRPSGILVILILATFVFPSSPFAKSDGDSVQSYTVQFSCDSSLSLNGSDDNADQEEHTDAVKDSVEFSAYISKWKENCKIIPKAFEFSLSEYKPPFVEKEQRPPQTSIV